MGEKKTVFVDMTRRAPSPFRERDKQPGGADAGRVERERGKKKKGKKKKKRVSGEQRDDQEARDREVEREKNQEKGVEKSRMRICRSKGGTLSGRCEEQGRGGLWWSLPPPVCRGSEADPPSRWLRRPPQEPPRARELTKPHG